MAFLQNTDFHNLFMLTRLKIDFYKNLNEEKTCLHSKEIIVKSMPRYFQALIDNGGN